MPCWSESLKKNKQIATYKEKNGFDTENPALQEYSGQRVPQDL